MLNWGTFTLLRLNAHRMVLAAAALTTLVTETRLLRRRGVSGLLRIGG